MVFRNSRINHSLTPSAQQKSGKQITPTDHSTNRKVQYTSYQQPEGSLSALTHTMPQVQASLPLINPFIFNVTHLPLHKSLTLQHQWTHTRHGLMHHWCSLGMYKSFSLSQGVLPYASGMFRGLWCTEWSNCYTQLFIVHIPQHFIAKTTASGVMVPPGLQLKQRSMLGAHRLRATQNCDGHEPVNTQISL